MIARLIWWINLKDPMTGFMVARKDIFDKIKLTPRGFKVVIEVVTNQKQKKTIEVPITFQERNAGHSKVGFNEHGMVELLRIVVLLLDGEESQKMVENYIINVKPLDHNTIKHP